MERKIRPSTVESYYNFLLDLYRADCNEDVIILGYYRRKHMITRKIEAAMKKKLIVVPVGHCKSSFVKWNVEVPSKQMAIELINELNVQARILAANKRKSSNKTIAVMDKRSENRKSTILYEISPDELMEMIEKAVAVRLEKFKKDITIVEKNEFMSRQETADYLKCSLFTIHLWVKKGIITPLKMGNRTYFERKEIESKLLNSNKQ